jgi:two-component sensor histidine kinase
VGGLGLAPVGEMRFLAGDGEMARRIRMHDWASHPFGPPATWPQALRASVGIALQSTFPMAIYWGPDLRLIYNDAWALIPGPRHPAALGAPARDVWSDIWHVIEPQFTRLLTTGEGVSVENQLLPMRRFGVPEETYWSYSFTAIRGEDGTVAGVFNTGSETTRTVLIERHMRFLLDLAEALRPAVDAEAPWRQVIEMLGSYLAASRVAIVRGGRDGALAVAQAWSAQGSEGGADAALAALEPAAAAALSQGRVVRVDDVRRIGAGTDAGLGAEGAERAAEAGVGAFAVVPWREEGAPAGAVVVVRPAARAWSDIEVGTVEEAVLRTMTAIERERAAERETILAREVDHRARNVLAVAQSVVRLSRADDIASFRAKIEERIGALARAHSLLAAERWSAVDLETLLAQELAPYGDDAPGRVHLDGPPVPLPAEITQTVALVLHELAANAAKHGSIGQDGGTLAVAWRLEAGSILHLDWTERLPEAARGRVISDHRGFGTTLLGRVIEGQLGGTIEQSLEPGGLRCRIALPLEPLGRLGKPGGMPAPEQGPRPLQVMIAEDEALLAMDIEAMVAGLGYGVFGVFGSPEEALGAIAAKRPDVAVLGADLHGTSSAPIAERLNALGVPVIVAAGYDEVPALSPSMRRAPRVTKPVSEAELASALARVSSRR